MSYFDHALAAINRNPPKIQDEDAVFWRREDPVTDDKGDIIRGGMFLHQRAWWDLPNFIRVLVGGYGAGKTLIGSKNIISAALENAPCPVAGVSPSFQMARTTIVSTVSTLLAGKRSIYGKAFWWKYNSTNHEFKIRFHGREGTIIVYSGDNPDALKGPNLAYAWIDEPFLQDEAVFKQMVARVRHPDAVRLGIALTGTPEQLNWGFDLCVGELSNRHDVGVIRGSTRQNKAIDVGYVSRLEGSFDGKAGSAYIDGNFVNLSEGLVYHAFDPTNNVRTHGTMLNGVESIPEHAELGVGMDFNVNPMCAAVFWRLGRHVHFIDEIILPNADTEFMCGELRERYGARLVNVYPDASGSQKHSAGGKSDFYYIQQAGFIVNAPPGNPDRRDRYNAFNGKLKARSGEVTLTISPRCKRLIKFLSTYCYEEMNKQEHMSHLLDAAGYPIAHLYPVTRDTLTQYRLRGT